MGWRALLKCTTVVRASFLCLSLILKLFSLGGSSFLKVRGQHSVIWQLHLGFCGGLLFVLLLWERAITLLWFKKNHADKPSGSWILVAASSWLQNSSVSPSLSFGVGRRQDVLLVFPKSGRGHFFEVLPELPWSSNLYEWSLFSRLCNWSSESHPSSFSDCLHWFLVPLQNHYLWSIYKGFS